jgi:hypothetical protein
MLDRALQRRILEALSACYPDGTYDLCASLQAHGAQGAPADDERALLVNTQYLHELGLVASGFVRRQTIGDNSFMAVGQHCITAAGLDFLADDGGIGAMLRTVTIRLDAQQWTELLARKVEAAQGLSHEEKSGLAAMLRKLPAKATEKLSEKLLDWAVDHWQDALPLLRTWLDQVVA